MKNYILSFILFLCITKIFGQQDTLVILGNKYLMIRQNLKNDFGVMDSLLKMYRLENNARKYLLTHYLYKYGKDCNNTFVDIGTIEYRSDSIVFKTIFNQIGHDPIPEKQTQIYKVQNNGKLKLLYDKVYLNGKWINTKVISISTPN